MVEFLGLSEKDGPEAGRKSSSRALMWGGVLLLAVIYLTAGAAIMLGIVIWEYHAPTVHTLTEQVGDVVTSKAALIEYPPAIGKWVESFRLVFAATLIPYITNMAKSGVQKVAEIRHRNGNGGLPDPEEHH